MATLGLAVVRLSASGSRATRSRTGARRARRSDFDYHPATAPGSRTNLDLATSPPRARAAARYRCDDVAYSSRSNAFAGFGWSKNTPPPGRVDETVGSVAMILSTTSAKLAPGAPRSRRREEPHGTRRP